MLQRAAALIAVGLLLPLAGGAAVVDDAPPAASAETGSPALGPSVTTRHSVTVADPSSAEDLPGFSAGDDYDVAGPSACADGMVLVEGEYCTSVRHECKRWLDDQKLQFARCAEYAPEARCVGKKIRMRYCIDRYEMREADSDLPVNHQSFVTASKLCKAAGKRLCKESEWNFACEGEEMRPYPYGWSRKPVCNQDREDLFEQNPRRRVLKDHRQPVEANPECASPFGVQNMVGNVDETTFRDGATHAHPFRNALKGGWWMAGRNRCRPATTAHDDYYEDIQVGVRCCADVPGGETAASG